MSKKKKQGKDVKKISSSKLLQFWANNNVLVSIVLLVIAILLPVIIKQQYVITVAIYCGIFSVLSLSLNLITGYMGITSIGHAAFFGIGAYTAAILATRFGWNFIFTFLAGALVASLFGILLALPTLRVRGRYLAIVTLGFGEIARMIELNWGSLTRGPMGIPNIPKMGMFGVQFKTPMVKYYIVLSLVVLTALIVKALMNSRAGRAIGAIKDDDVAAGAMGINVFKHKVVVFAISSALAGLAGAYYAHYMSFIDPNGFNFQQSILMLSMIIFGGMASIPGSIFGAIALTVLPEMLRFLSAYRQVIYGILLIVMLIYRPNGLLGGFNLKHVRERYLFNKNKKGVS